MGKRTKRNLLHDAMASSVHALPNGDVRSTREGGYRISSSLRYDRARMKSAIRSYGFSILLLASIGAGVVLGAVAPNVADTIRPLGDLYLNLIFMVIVPLVFFTVSSSIAGATSTRKLSRVSLTMLVVFVATSVVAAVASMLFFLVVSPAPGAGLTLANYHAEAPPPLLAQLVKTFTTPDFPELLSRKSMLPLIVLAAGVGLAVRASKDRGEPIARLLVSGAAVFTKLIDFVMYVAPVGLFAWFAATVVDTGAQLAGAYLTVFAAYYAFGGAYYALGFTAYAWLAGRGAAVRRFWANMLRPSVTALGTCSSMATLPANLEAAPRMGVPSYIGDLVIPIGTAIHKDGSVIGGMAKVLFAMSLFHEALTPGLLAAAVGVAILVGVVMGAIPSGGMIGEALILSVFGFPAQVLPLLAIISIVIDPLATLINATGHNVAAMLVTRATDGDVWNDNPVGHGDAAHI